MNERALTVRVDGSINMDSGEFPMILATDGEASDGDILSIEGMQFPERAPLQNAHINEARSTLGSITRFRRDLQSTPKKLRATGQIEMAGDGPQSDIRRDIAFMVSRGHIKGVSVRWQPIEWIRRINLPEDHPAYVNGETEKDWRKRYGLFFKRSRVLEGSIAPVQADPQSMIGRADETKGEVAQFWRSMAKDTRERKSPPFPDANEFDTEFDFMRAALPVALEMADSGEDAHELCLSAWQERQPDEDEEPSERAEAEHSESEASDPPSPEALAAAAGAQLRELLSQGLDPDALLEIARETAKPEPTTEEKLERALERITALEAQLSERDQDRVPGEPVPPLRSVSQIMRRLEVMIEERQRRTMAAVRALVDKKRGRLPEERTYRELMHDEADQLLEKKLGPRGGSSGADPTPPPDLVERLESAITQAAQRRASERASPEG